MLELDPLLLLIHLGIYLVFLFLFGTFAVKPIVAHLKLREQRLGGLRRKSDELAAELQALRTTLEQRTAEAQIEGGKHMDAVRKRASDEEHRLLEEARAAASNLIKQTETHLAEQLVTARADLERRLSEISGSIVSRLGVVVLGLCVMLEDQALASSAEGGHHASIGDLLFPAINFAILVVLLFKVLKKPLSTMLQKRRTGVADFIAQHEQRQEQLAAELATLRDRVSGLDQIVAEIVEDKRAAAMADYEKTLAHARAVAAQIADNTERICASMIVKATAELVDEALDRAIAEAGLQLAGRKNLGVEQVLGSPSLRNLWAQN
ncbi:MAG: hypothetical protein A2284_06340 [Deltaproteobacteria bacterium RIFOXYA12_FULL_61_11]|nr:MAG: hypothetical protein A2284_06340 [Deltaproteobacteria bacterium RIFOXYA12_FULL_61_11]